MDSEAIYNAVGQHYSAISSNATPEKHEYSSSVARAFGYTSDQLCSIPAESNLGVSCGNPLAIASLREGETVIDLGSGAGFDVFLAARAVGPNGRVTGVDMNPDMLALAAKNKAKFGATNVDFVEARITQIPLESGIADVIISNCVINLVPEMEKPKVFREMHRLLKPGGRVAVSDILAKTPLSANLQSSLAAYVGCIAGASLVTQYQNYFRQSGFEDVVISDAQVDLNVYINPSPNRTRVDQQSENGGPKIACCPTTTPSHKPLSLEEVTKPGNIVAQTADRAGSCHDPTKALNSEMSLKDVIEMAGMDLNEWVGSFKLFAVKR